MERFCKPIDPSRVLGKAKTLCGQARCKNLIHNFLFRVTHHIGMYLFSLVAPVAAVTYLGLMPRKKLFARSQVVTVVFDSAVLEAIDRIAYDNLETRVEAIRRLVDLS